MNIELPKESLISFMGTKVKQGGGINLAQGLPGFDPPKELIEELKIASDKDNHQYQPNMGNFSLVDKIIKSYKNHYSLTNNNIIVTCGATEALSLLFLYLKEKISSKFSVLSFDPPYEVYKQLPKLFNIPFVPVKYPVREDDNLSYIENEIIKNNVKIIFVSSPGNPFGKILSKNNILQLLVLAKKYDIYIIFDAVYKDLYFEKPPYLPLDKLCSNLFYVNSFSKQLSITGWRIGYLICDESHIRDLKNMHDYTGLCAPSVLQEAIANYLDKYLMGKDYIDYVRKQLKQNYYFFKDALTMAGIDVSDIDGGYFIWTKLPEKHRNGFEFALNLYAQTKVAVVPGIHFSDNAINYIRINFARPVNELEVAKEKILQFFKNNKYVI